MHHGTQDYDGAASLPPPERFGDVLKTPVAKVLTFLQPCTEDALADHVGTRGSTSVALIWLE